MSEKLPVIDNFRVSVSKAKTFLDCKKKYKFTYIDKLPRKSQDFHVLGTFCHLVLEEFYKSYIAGSVEPFVVEMTKAYKIALKEFSSQMTKEMKDEAWGFINNYLKKINADKKQGVVDQVLQTEEPFAFTIETDNLQIVLNGAIDRIQKDSDGLLHVIDYKTTKNKKYLKNDFFQLKTYMYVLMMRDPSIARMRASYMLLRHDFELITIECDRAEIEEVKNTFVSYVSKILEEQEFSPNPTMLCNWCDFLEHCPQGGAVAKREKVFGEIGY